MGLNLTKTYTPTAGDVANTTSYNTDISSLFNAFIGLEAQTSTLNGLKITPTSNAVSVFNVTNAAGTSIMAVDTTNSKITIVSTTRYYMVSPADFTTNSATTVMEVNSGSLKSSSNTTGFTAVAGVHLPNGAVVTGVNCYWYRNDASATGTCRLVHNDSNDNTLVSMAVVDSNASTGYHTVSDTSITDATIDNTARSYMVQASIDPNDLETDVYLTGVLVAYTITTPLP
jgi:hypothetical protein